MKKQYSKEQIQKAIDYWNTQLVNESLSESTEEKLKEAAKNFAKWFGKQIKNGGMKRVEDGNFDALTAVKNTIKVNSSVKNFKEAAKKNGLIPEYALDKVAEISVKEFISNVFAGSKQLVDELQHAIDFMEKSGFEATEDYINALKGAIQDEKDKKLQNLKKTTEQFNYFANEVFMKWKRDPEISQTMGRFPEFPTPESVKEENSEEHSEDEDQDTETVDEQQKDSEQDDQSSDNNDVQEKEELDDETFIKQAEENKEEEKIEECDSKIKTESVEYAPNTVGSLIKVLKENCSMQDMILPRIDRKECFIFDIHSSNGHAVLDFAKGRPFDPSEI